MQPVYNYKKFAVLYVDDEEKSLKYFERAFSDTFRIFTASSAQQGLEILEANKDQIGILMTDQRMPGEKGTWLLEKARALRPRIIRILATAYADMESAISAVNTGSIWKYVTKPWDPAQLELTLLRGLEFFIVQQERDNLLREKMSVLHNMMIADRIVSLGLLAAGMSHHIRNSLVAVKTFLDLAPIKLQEENPEVEGLRNPSFWKDYYQNVQGQVQRINQLLSDLWEVSEKPTFAFTDRVNLTQLASETIARIQPEMQARKITVVNEIPADLPLILADEPKIRRLFELLLRDEVVSLPEGTTIHFRGSVGDDIANPDVRFEMQDDGPGLPQEALRLLFDPFVVRSDSPMEYGISLMACYFIVHHHGGRIDARSGAERGTVFTVRLPLNSNQPPLPIEERDFLQKVLLNETLWEKLVGAE